jgi:hypothetical protein
MLVSAVSPLLFFSSGVPAPSLKALMFSSGVAAFSF